MGIFQDIKSVIISPYQFFEAQAKEDNIKRGLAVTAFVFTVTLIVETVVELMISAGNSAAVSADKAVIGLTEILGMVFAFSIGLFSWLFFIVICLAICAGILHFSAKLCGGQGRFKSLFTCLLFSEAVALIVLVFVAIKLLIFLFIGQTGTILVLKIVDNICLFIWATYLYIIIVKQCYQLPTGKAALAVIVSAILLIVLFIWILTWIFIT